ncbi:fumarylacetoacetate hydrolase domain-containing protein 2A-like isoform X1 [Homalodisca vitripennis]|uniref:Fumarylacetoacetase-like C-terminal domain-containing protein n=2 Tax=Homalodisca TaxID=139475 RepID=A0A1B6IE47_9HEMI|nr:fumarylacetoacetate hydrolase domain-containing protein 2A-like isoform X1 [Homalodisca vitripennis]
MAIKIVSSRFFVSCGKYSRFSIHRLPATQSHPGQILKCINNSVNLKRQFSVSNNPLRMRFVQFRCLKGGPQRLGVQLTQEGDVIDISAVDSSIPNNLVQFLENGPSLLEKAKRIVGEGKSTNQLSEVELLAPVTRPDKILCVGLNYKAHCDEQKKPYPVEPFFFNKFPSTIVSPNGKVTHPPNTKKLDWEVELTVVIGQKCRNVQASDALKYVFGYTIAQDISARDWQTPKKNNGQWLFAKSMDTFCPLGPAVVVKEAFGAPNDKTIKCSINGSVKQNSNTNDLIHSVEDLIAYLSHCVTLLPGDLILTGTPGGVGLYSNPQQFLAPGDVIESEISGIGKLISHVV